MIGRARFDLLIRHDRSPDKLRSAAAVSAELRAEIKAELALLAGVSPDRCVVTKEYVAALKEALG